MKPESIDVWILDSSALVRTKVLITVSNQWDAFKLLEQMVRDGAIAMPRLVIKELSEIAHPDLPGAWAPGVRDLQVHPLDPDYSHMAHVMDIAGDVVDVNKQKEDADPWVLALARQLNADGLATCIVTEDIVDRVRISIATACERLSLTYCGTRDFLGHCGIATVKEKPAPDDSADD